MLLSTISVATYGATPNDGLDDRAAIQAAVNASQSGDTVSFGNGIYNLAAAITLKSGRTYAGNSTALVCPTTLGPMIRTENNFNHATIQGFTLSGGGMKIGDGADLVTIQNNIIRDIPPNSPVGFGLYLPASFTNGHIANNTFININATMLMGYGSWTNSQVTGNSFDTSTEAIHIVFPDGQKSSNITVSGNTVRHISRHGIELQGGPTNLYVENNRVSDFTTGAEGHMALSIATGGQNGAGRGSGIYIRNNVLAGTGQGWLACAIEGMGDNLVISGNWAANFACGQTVSLSHNWQTTYNIWVQIPTVYAPDGGPWKEPPAVNTGNTVIAKWDGQIPGEAATLPAVPSGLSAAIRTTQVQLTWSDNSGNETGFQIERSTDGASFSPIATVAENTSTYTDSGLTAPTTYTYRVRAYNNVGQSAPSNTAVPGVQAAGVPNAPSGLDATPVSNSRIDLAWIDNSSNETAFSIEQATDQVHWWPSGTVPANVRVYSVLGVAAATVRYFRVKAYNGSGSSDYTPSAVGWTYPLAAPASFVAQDVNSSRVDLSWADLSANEAGFRIDRTTDNINYTTATVSANTTRYSVTGLAPNTRYYFRLRSYVSGGGESAVLQTNAATAAAGAPSIPTNLATTPVSESRINLTWTDNGIDETGFKIERSANNSTWAQIATVAPNTTTFAATGLAPSATYWFRIRSYRGTVNSAYSLAASGWTYALAGPTNLAALTVSSVQVNLTWTDACRNEAGFRIERSTDNVTYGVIAWLAANSTSFAAGALTPSTRYYFRVRGYLTSTQLSAPIGASAVTQAVVTPPAPSNLAAARYSVSRIDLSWKDNASNEDGFVLQKSTGSGTWSQVATLVANLTSYSVTGLAMGVTYSYRICAYNARGNSIWSNTSSAMTYPMYAPISPVATALSVSRIQVTWVDRADNESGYAIERSTNGTSFTQVATVAANTTSYTVSGLTAGTRYYYRVRGWTSLGYSGYSAIVSATTPAAAAPFSLQTVAYSFSDGDPLLDQQQVQ